MLAFFLSPDIISFFAYKIVAETKKNRLHAARATHSLKQYENFAMSKHRFNALHCFLGVLVAAESR